MLTLSPSVRVFVVVAPLDMRGSFDAIAGAVRRLGLEPAEGHLYLFLNKRRRIAKEIYPRNAILFDAATCSCPSGTHAAPSADYS